MTSAAAWVAGLGRVLPRVPAWILVGLLRGYRLLVSPLYGQTCRFYPSCSAFALEAVQCHGAIRGGWLAIRRLLRCHPWNPGGVDPVPAVAGRRAGRRDADPDPDSAPLDVPHPDGAPDCRHAA